MATVDFATWFSGSYETKEAAQEWYKYSLFNPAAVFRLAGGGFALAYIREQNCPPHRTAVNIRELTGNVMVSYCDPLLGIWKDYSPDGQTCCICGKPFVGRDEKDNAYVVTVKPMTYAHDYCYEKESDNAAG